MENPFLSLQNLVNFFWALTFTVQLVFLTISIMIYWRTRQRVFAAYSIFLVFLLFYLSSRLPFDDLWLYDFYQQKWTIVLVRYFQVWALVAQIHFLLFFLDVDRLNATLFHRVQRLNKLLVLLGTAFGLYCLITTSFNLFSSYYYLVHGPLAIGSIVYLYLGVRRFDGLLKHFFIYGNLIFFFSVIISSIFSMRPLEGDSIFYKAPILIFYLGLIIEMIIFSLGLAQKISEEYTQRLDTENELRRLEMDQNNFLQKELEAREKELKKLFEERQIEQELVLKKDFEDVLNRMELDVLRAQMNPHLLFNSLNTLKHFIITEDQDRAIDYLGKLSRYMRRSLQMTSVRSISLDRELSFMHLYVEMENMRFDQDVLFTLENRIGGDLDQFEVPPMLLQPIIENAFHHGLVRKNGHKEIRILIERKENLEIRIQDNGIGLTESGKYHDPSRKSRGIDLLRKRMELAYGLPSKGNKHLHIHELRENESCIGTEIILYIPLEK